MIRVIMHGCNGRMGQVITGIVAAEPDMEIVAGIDISQHISNTYPVFSNISDCNIKADVIIDFASAQSLTELLQYCREKEIPCVQCTTGLTEEQKAEVEAVSKDVAVLRSANMSMGINLLLKMLKEAAGVLAPAGYDIEIIEKHHNQKLDAPSGTALALADSINEELQGEYTYVYDRSQKLEKRKKKEIGISAVRGASIVGEHDVLFAGMDEVITFSHTAYSRNIFAKGAVQAAKFLHDKGPGMYQMSDVIDENCGIQK